MTRRFRQSFLKVPRLGWNLAAVLRRFIVILTDLADTGVVSLLGAPTDGQQLEVVGEGFQDGVGGTFFICIELLLLVDRSASPFAGLRSTSILK
jgi:hypothetical protein